MGALEFNFKIEDSEFSKYFTIEPPETAKPDKNAKEMREVKGALTVGKSGPKVAFRFNPPQDNSLAYGDISLDLLSGIGQWVSCTVKGSLTNPPQEITVELKAYLQQICCRN